MIDSDLNGSISDIENPRILKILQNHNVRILKILQNHNRYVTGLNRYVADLHSNVTGLNRDVADLHSNVMGLIGTLLTSIAT